MDLQSWEGKVPSHCLPDPTPVCRGGSGIPQITMKKVTKLGLKPKLPGPNGHPCFCRKLPSATTKLETSQAEARQVPQTRQVPQVWFVGSSSGKVSFLQIAGLEGGSYPRKASLHTHTLLPLGEQFPTHATLCMSPLRLGPISHLDMEVATVCWWLGLSLIPVCLHLLSCISPEPGPASLSPSNWHHSSVTTHMHHDHIQLRLQVCLETGAL